ncbi:hypothetical protein LINPERHAP2_LOCUS37355 [Linum perenne]
MIEDRTFFVEYESLENICATCGFYGHKAGCCASEQDPDHPTDLPDEGASKESAPESDGTGVAGDWMVVQQRGRGQGRKDSQVPSKQPQLGSRYSALCEEEVVIPTQPTAAVSARPNKTLEADRMTADLAAKLAEVLKQATNMKENKETSAKVIGVSEAPRQPLSDLTNSTKGKGKVSNATKPADVVSSVEFNSSQTLVNIPVVYDNPTFMGAMQSSTSKPKKQVPKRARCRSEERDWLSQRRIYMAHLNFPRLISRAWEAVGDTVENLKVLSGMLRRWNREVFGNISQRKAALMLHLAEIERASSVNPSPTIKKAEDDTRRALQQTLWEEAVLWAQKSRVDWINDVDLNTRFFHQSTIRCRAANKLVMLRRADGTWEDDGDRLKTSRWVDSGVRLIDAIIDDVAEVNLSDTVASFVNEEGQWDVTKLREVLPANFVNQVVGMSPPRENAGEDQWVWGEEDSGRFTVKSAYGIVNRRDSHSDVDVWRSIWNWKDASCEFCHASEESTTHVLRDCAFAAESWRKLGALDVSGSHWQGDIVTWMKHFLRDGSKSLLFGVHCWMLWRNRNDRIFSGTNHSPHIVAQRSINWAGQVASAMDRNGARLGINNDCLSSDI